MCQSYTYVHIFMYSFPRSLLRVKPGAPSLPGAHLPQRLGPVFSFLHPPSSGRLQADAALLPRQSGLCRGCSRMTTLAPCPRPPPSVALFSLLRLAASCLVSAHCPGRVEGALSSPHLGLPAGPHLPGPRDRAGRLFAPPCSGFPALWLSCSGIF